ncbi:MAG: calcium-binding protein, partial [Waterburya sp.]
ADGIGNNILIAGEGRDTVGAGVGNDSIDAGADNDFIMGSSNLVTQVYEGLVSGYDELVNENLALVNIVFGYEYEGDDTLIPGGDYEVGDDFIKAGTGNDFMILYGGDNTLLAGAGDDEVLGGIDNDFINGGAGNDFVFGYEGDDTLIAGEGNDRLIGSAGNDRLIGIAENSTTFGKGEIDTLQGKVGSDRFVLGDATQTFYNDEDNGSEGIEDYAVIQDFNPNEDVIELSEAEGIYLLGSSPIEGISGTGLYIDQLDSETDELVAVIEGISPDDLDINASYFANWNNPAIDDAPVVEHEIVDVTVNEDSENTVIDLTNVFSDVDGDAIAISLVDNTNSNLVTGTIVNNQLTLDYLENQFGTSEITIRGTSNNQTVDETFAITVNPVDDVLVVNDAIS